MDNNWILQMCIERCEELEREGRVKTDLDNYTVMEDLHNQLQKQSESELKLRKRRRIM